MTSWNRRLNAASAATSRGGFSRGEFLKEAVALGAPADDQAALLAMARLVGERDDFSVTVVVRTNAEPVPIVVSNGPEGPVARLADQIPAKAPPRIAGPDDDAAVESDVMTVLTDTLVQTPDLVAIFAGVGHEAIWANDAFVTLVPIRAADKIWLVELLDEWSKGHYEVKILPALVKVGRWSGRLTLITGEDEQVSVSAVMVAHRDERGEISAVSMVARDLSELDLSDELVRSDGGQFAALVEHASDLIAVLGSDGLIRYVSPAAVRVLGHDDASLVGTALFDLVHPDDIPGDLMDLVAPDDLGVGSPVELRLRAADGSWRHLELVLTDLTSNPVIDGLVLNARDVTERVRALNALTDKAYTDQMTGLPNRMRLIDRMNQALDLSTREGSVCAALCDIDNFKAINEGFGQVAADAFLREIADRLVSASGSGATVARVRSDEFVVLLSHVGDAGDAVRTANRLRSVVADPFVFEAVKMATTMSVGIAFSGSDQGPEDLLRDADQALTHAKEGGGDRTELFSPAFTAQAEHRRIVERQLRARIDSDDLVLFYQPIVDLETRKVVSAEALLRLRDDDGDLMNPAELIGAAESSGLIAKLGTQVLRATGEQLAVWLSRSEPLGIDEISVNISPRQLADPDLPNQVQSALSASGIDPGRFCLEITENIFIGRQSTIDASVSYLRALGVKIGLDEFGSGQSSLSYLKRFPLDFVKIDRSLIEGLGKSERDTAIVRATIDLAHNLDLTVIAVGVENQAQLDALELMECDRIQGYLFAPPLAPGEFESHATTLD